MSKEVNKEMTIRNKKSVRKIIEDLYGNGNGNFTPDETAKVLKALLSYPKSSISNEIS